MTHQDITRPLGAPRGEDVGIGDALDEAMRLASREAEHRGDGDEDEFGELVRGMLPGELLAVCGEPGTGKTSLALRIAIEAARGGTPVLFFSLESSAADIGRRLLSIETGTPLASLVRSGAGSERRELLERAATKLKGLDIRIIDDFSLDIARLEGIVRGYAEHGTRPLVIADRADAFGFDEPCDELHLSLAFLKRLAGRHGVRAIATLGHDDYRNGLVCKASDIVVAMRRRGVIRPKGQTEDYVTLEVLKSRRKPVSGRELSFDRASGRLVEFRHIHDATELLDPPGNETR